MQKIAIMGDFNIDLMVERRNTHSEHFLEILASFDFEMQINEPTRVTLNSSTLIDNIFTNFSTVKSGNMKVGISDHYLQFANWSVGNPIAKKNLYSTKRIQNPESINKFNNELNQFNWNQFNNPDIDSRFEDFFRQFILIMNSCFPEVRKKIVGIEKTWVTNGIMNASKLKRSLYEIFCRDRNNVVAENNFKNQCTVCS